MRLSLWISAACILAIGGVFLPEFYITAFTYIGLYALVALGLVLLTGVAGITSFGQAAFVGLGAYTTAVLTTYLAVSPWLGLIAALLVVVTSAGLLGVVTLRLSGHYLPLATLGWGVSLYYVFGNLDMLGAHTGMDGIPPISIAGFAADTTRSFYYIVWAVCLGACVLFSNMLDSRAGRAMRAIKNAKITAESFGVDTARFKMILFIYAAVLAGISGWLYAHFLRFVNPSPFGLHMGIEYLFMVVVGGAGQVWGALLGAGIITLMKDYLQDILPRLVGQSGNFEVIVFGALIIVLLQTCREQGVTSLLARFTPPFVSGPAQAESMTDSLAPRPRLRTRKDGEAILRVDGISKSFGGLQALKDIGFDVFPREVVALIGPNGAGKSTLFNTVTGLLPADAGQVWVNGEDATKRKAREIVSMGVARTFQHVQLVPELTVLENAMLGAHQRSKSGSIKAALRLERDEEAQIRAEALRQLARVNLLELQHEPAGNLALGQQRVLEMARALCADPDIMLLDEPAAGLRFREKQDLAQLISELRDSGVSVLLVEHDMDFVMNLADRIVVLNFGEKLLEGVPEEVRANPSVVEAYLGSEAA
ncbi:MAG: branched-chain amino acid ABC transporter ATP-binding protein/permease [Aquisalimonadaceae bacterium]